MSTFTDAVDRVYRAPLSAFVAERRALAKQQPANAAVINALQKPTVAAWAVNQLFWTKRKTIDQLIKAAERVRDVQLRRLSGKPADLDAAERARRLALERTMDDVTSVLVAAGEQASAATLGRVRQTLETLPWTTIDGRLTRAITPTGLEGLAALMKGGPIASRPPAPVLPIRRVAPPSPPDTAAETQRKARAQVREKIATMERALSEARVAERHARREAEHAARTRRALESQLAELRRRARQSRAFKA